MFPWQRGRRVHQSPIPVADSPPPPPAAQTAPASPSRADLFQAVRRDTPGNRALLVLHAPTWVRDPEQLQQEGKTLLEVAAEADAAWVLELAQRAGMGEEDWLRARADGSTLMHLAAACGSREFAGALMNAVPHRKRALFASRDMQGRTPLDMAMAARRSHFVVLCDRQVPEFVDEAAMKVWAQLRRTLDDPMRGPEAFECSLARRMFTPSGAGRPIHVGTRLFSQEAADRLMADPAQCAALGLAPEEIRQAGLGPPSPLAAQIIIGSFLVAQSVRSDLWTRPGPDFAWSLQLLDAARVAMPLNAVMPQSIREAAQAIAAAHSGAGQLRDFQFAPDVREQENPAHAAPGEAVRHDHHAAAIRSLLQHVSPDWARAPSELEIALRRLTNRTGTAHISVLRARMYYQVNGPSEHDPPAMGSLDMAQAARELGPLLPRYAVLAATPGTDSVGGSGRHARSGPHTHSPG